MAEFRSHLSPFELVELDAGAGSVCRDNDIFCPNTNPRRRPGPQIRRPVLSGCRCRLKLGVLMM